MRTTFTDAAPVADVRCCGLVFLTFEGDRHPVVTTPIHVVREFCEVTLRKLNAWEAEQSGRVVPLREGQG